MIVSAEKKKPEGTKKRVKKGGAKRMGKEGNTKGGEKAWGGVHHAKIPIYWQRAITIREKLGRKRAEGKEK